MNPLLFGNIPFSETNGRTHVNFTNSTQNQARGGNKGNRSRTQVDLGCHVGASINTVLGEFTI